MSSENPFVSEPADEQERAKIVKAIKAGRVEVDPEVAAAISRMDLANPNPDFTITDASIAEFWGPGSRSDGGCYFRWQTQSAGCGGVRIYRRADRLMIEDEGMGRAFVLKVFRYILKHATLESDFRERKS
jgi:hypothetical protein